MRPSSAGTQMSSLPIAPQGRDPWEPVVIVERAAMPDERMIPGRLATIAEIAGAAAIESPAVLIVGGTVKAATVSIATQRAFAYAASAGGRAGRRGRDAGA